MLRSRSLLCCLCVLSILGCTRVTSSEEGQEHMSKTGEEFMEYLDKQQDAWYESLIAEEPSSSSKSASSKAPVVDPPVVIVSSSSSVASSSSSSLSSQSSSSAPVIATQLYRNSEFTFSVQYIGTVVNESAGYIRMQNYDAAPDRFVLTPKDYYLEISVVRPDTSTENIMRCLHSYPGATQVKVGAAMGYRTTVFTAEKQQSILCIERQDATLYFVVTDVSEGRYGQTILNTVKFRLP